MRAFLLVLAVILAAPQSPPPSPDAAVPFDGRWVLTGDRTKIRTESGRTVLEVETGVAARRDIKLLDGRIDFDVRLTRRRSFVYVYFRSQSDGEREEFYLRPHKSGLPDALQYAPVWQGRSAWQLHHGSGATAAVPFETDRWTHVRLVIRGRSAALFVDDMTRPALIVPRLSREPQAGGVALGGFLPADAPGTGPIATFANVRVRSGHVPSDFPAVSGEELPGDAPGIVREWAVSRAVAAPAGAAAAAIPDPVAVGPFVALATEPSGLLQLHRHVPIPDGIRASSAVARLTVTSATARTVAFDLGFSDGATVFLNGAPLYTGDASYSYDRPRREGLIGFDQARLYLPLSAGENTLVVVVRDSFGGWGLMGRFVDPDGLTVAGR